MGLVGLVFVVGCGFFGGLFFGEGCMFLLLLVLCFVCLVFVV